MKPFFFGRPGRRLYGVYHQSPHPEPRGAVVVCPPFGQEHLRAHRALRVLAEGLGSAGWSVLRFDLFGTGNSDGDLLDATVDGWVDDARVALDEVGALSGRGVLVAAGLRHGASLAARAASMRRDVDALMLWDPVVDGRGWWDQAAGGGAPLQVDGFGVAPDLRDGLRGIDPDWLDAGDPPPVAVVVTTAPSPAGEELLERLARKTRRLQRCRIEAPPPWAEENDFGAGPVPASVIRAFVEWTP